MKTTDVKSEGGVSGRNILRFFTGPIVGIAVAVIVLLVFALIVAYTEAGEGVIGVAGFVAGGLGAFVAGFINARRMGRQGLLSGLTAGVIMFVLLYIIGFIVSGQLGTLGNAIGMLLTIAACALVAGVLAINTKR